MTALGLTLMGLAPGVVAAVVYWCGRAFERRQLAARQELHALAASPGGQAFARRLQVINSFGILATPWPPPPEVHIEVLKFRATKQSSRLAADGQRLASNHIDEVIKAGDREALLALLREENA
jgi:hypothetical protein